MENVKQKQTCLDLNGCVYNYGHNDYLLACQRISLHLNESWALLSLFPNTWSFFL